jgi:hypothetical protein
MKNLQIMCLHKIAEAPVVCPLRVDIGPEVVNKLSIWLCLFPSAEAQRYLRMLRCDNTKLFTIIIPDVTNFITLILLSLLASCKPSFATLGFIINFLRTLALIYLKRRSRPTNGLDWKLPGIIHRNCPLHHFYPLVEHGSSEHNHESATRLTVTNTLYLADMIPFCTKNPIRNSRFSFP